MAPEDLREYAGLVTTTITCRQRLKLGAAGVVRALLAHGRVSVGAIDGDDDTMPARLAANSRFLLQRKDLADTIVDLLVGAGADR